MLANLAVLVLLPVLVVLAATWMVGRSARTRSDGETDPDTLSFVGGVFNAAFIVVLAFYVVFAWQTGEDIDNNAVEESNALINIHQQVAVAPAEDRDAIRSLVRDYAGQVADSEWALLASDRTDPSVPAILDDLRARIQNLPVDDERVIEARSIALTDIRSVDEFHRQRVDDSTSGDTFNEILLVGMIIGSVLMVVFPLLIGITPSRRHLTVMGVLAVTLGAIVFVSIELMDPLNGVLAKDPDAFRDVLDLSPADG